MVSFDDRMAKVLELARALEQNRDRIVELAVKDLQFTVKDSRREVELSVARLAMLSGVQQTLRNRIPLGGPGSRVALMLSYNGSAWLNTAITSIYIVGNKVDVRFSSKARKLMAFTEGLYRPIFGDDICFCEGTGKEFMNTSVRDPAVSAVVVFGFDDNVLPYESLFRSSGKKLVFEGPGQDPFIVFQDADLEFALQDLMVSKFSYSGQTCVAPKRIFVHASIYEEFLERFVERVRRLAVGAPENEMTDISPLASEVAVNNIATQIEDARQRGAEVLVGGKAEGRLIFPTVLKNCSDDMLGMREEVFGPVAFTTSFQTRPEVIARAKDHKYGLRAAVFGGPDAVDVAKALQGEDYCHPVSGYVFGKFGTVAYNEPRSVSWKGALITKPVGGYGYSGWIWETIDGRFQLKQGPKLFTLETSLAT